MENQKELTKLEKKRIELDCIDELISYVNFTIKATCERISDAKEKQENNVLDYCDLLILNELKQSVFSYEMLIEALENLIII